jgi:glycosyltransferase involved in cell wall biosynthesis/MoaA/NifB/PqqE/SkfB family radical SAM enzyme/predicted SAM-dependent methyltransferase
MTHLKLHLGCGHIRIDGFVNVDIDPQVPAVDLVDNIGELSRFSSNSASTIYACHVMEHFSTNEVLPVLLRWYDVLEPDGELRISVPDIDRIVKIYSKNWEHFQTPPNTPWIGLIYGGQGDQYDFHKTGFNFVYLKHLLEQAGFTDIEEYPHSPHWLGIEDASLANAPFNEYLSLNIKAKKPHSLSNLGKTSSESLSILHTVEFYYPHIGGAEIVVQQISERLARRGHRVEVATTKLSDRSFKQLNEVLIHEFEVSGNIANSINGYDIQRYQHFLINHPSDVMMNYAAQQWATDLAFDVIDKTKYRRANIIAPCGYSALIDSKTLRWKECEHYFNSIIPKVIPLYDAAIYHSALYKDYRYAQEHGFTNSIVIPNGVDEKEFTDEPKINFRHKYGIKTKFYGLCVANFYGGKGQDRVVECVRKMSRADFTMVLIGKEGDELQNLKKQAEGLNILFCVNIPREDTIAAYHEADIFLFGSYIEASPLVIIEAKASRTPFVSTDCGNVREWKGGIVCEPEEMAANVNRILDDEGFRKQLAHEGRKEWKDKLTWESVVDRYEDLYLKKHHEKTGHEKSLHEIATPLKSSVTGVIFSKDRPLQLDATIRSFLFHCCDANIVDLKVLYTTSSAMQQELYAELIKDYPSVRFVKEQNFRNDLLSLLNSSDYILFLVDDNIFVRDFKVIDVINSLSDNSDALGFSLRLGRNTTYCYPLDKEQRLPDIKPLEKAGQIKYDWTTAEYDFGYPLEVSSSVYRTKDILPFISGLPFLNPNSLEGYMAENAHSFKIANPLLLCFDRSITFCVPLNKVQNIAAANRTSSNPAYSPENLVKIFSDGNRIDVSSYNNFSPNACHQEVGLKLLQPAEKIAISRPLVSVIIPCYNQAQYLSEAVESVVAQTYTNWECIIVNDGSPDNTSDVAKELIARYSGRQMRLLEKPNGGLAAARNSGIRSSKGIYWLPLDADDRIAPSFMDKTVRYMEEHPEIGFVYSNIQHFGLEHNIFLYPDFESDTLVYGDNIVSVCSLVRKKVWEEVGGYNQDMREGYEDWDFWIGCVEKGWQGYRIPDPLFLYRKKEQSMLKDATKKRQKLISRIILNHPALYGERRCRIAELTLDNKSTDAITLNVLIICNHFWPSTDLLGVVAENIGLRFIREGYNVDVATFDAPGRSSYPHRGMNIIVLNQGHSWPHMTPVCFSQLRDRILSGKYKACILLSYPDDLTIWAIEDMPMPLVSNVLILPAFISDSDKQLLFNPEFVKRFPSILKKAAAVITLSSYDEEMQFYKKEGIATIRIPSIVMMRRDLSGQGMAMGVPDVSAEGMLHLHNVIAPFLQDGTRSHTFNMQASLVSVIIPCYNQAQYLPEAVESVVNQTYQNWECIIVNDGSPDNTSDVTRELIAKYPDNKIILLEKPNGGLADARNFGIRHSKGKYILPLDSDDFMKPERIEKMVALLESDKGIAIAYTDAAHFGSVNKIVNECEYDFGRLRFENHLNYSSMYRREAWDAAGGYNTNMKKGYEDWDFWISCGEKGFYGKRIPEPLLMYRVKESSMYTEALESHDELVARIILNHPLLYEEKDVAAAKAKLGIADSNSGAVSVASSSGGTHEDIGSKISNALSTISSSAGKTDSMPSQVHFLMNDRCNAKCIMCGGDYFRSKSGRTITLEKFKIMASNLRLQHFGSVVFAGAGDPLLNLELIPIIQFVRKTYPHLSISITTNGIALTEKISKLLVENNVNSINISINAATRKTYRRIMQVDCFDKVCANVRELVRIRDKAHQSMRVQLSSAINRLNIEEVPELVELGRDIGIDSINLMYCRFYPENIRNLNIEMTENSLNNNDSLFYHQELSDLMIEKSEILANNYRIGFTHEPLFRKNALPKPCTWHFNEIMIGFVGEVYPCGGSEVHFKEKVETGIYNFGNVLKEPLEAIWNNEQYRALRISSMQDGPCLIPECRYCANIMSPNNVKSHIMDWDEKPCDVVETGPSKPLVSVIVPTYNRPEMLVETLRSILDQIYKNIEIIVVNDAGADVEGLVQGLNRSNNIRYIRHTENEGLAASRNTGLKAAKGKYIAYLDDDDIYYPDHIETLVRILETSDHKVAYTDALRAYQEIRDGRYITVKKEIANTSDFNCDRILLENYIPVLCFMHEKSCIDEVGEFDETLGAHEDWDLWMRMSRKFRIAHIKKVTCEFSWRQDASTLTFRNIDIMDATRQTVFQRGLALQEKGSGKVNIPSTTLCCIDCYNHQLSIRALEYSMRQCGFDRVVFFTDREFDLEEIEVVKIPTITTKQQYSWFVLKELNKHVHTDFVLMVQYDGFIINPEAWTSEFQKYDYTGAKWHWYNDGYNVGNGGFSLRSKRLLQSLDDTVNNNGISMDSDSLTYGEDSFICRTYRGLLEDKYSIKFAPEFIADRFSYERSEPVGRPFGFHGLFNMWRYITPEYLTDFVNTLSPHTLKSIEALELGVNYHNAGRLKEAETVYRKILEFHPDHQEALSMLKTLKQPVQTKTKTGRNDPCHCGSGRKYKKCCGA